MTRERSKPIKTKRELDTWVLARLEEVAAGFARLNELLPKDVTHPYQPVGSAIHSGLGNLLAVKRSLDSELHESLPSGYVFFTSGRQRHDDPLPWRVVEPTGEEELRMRRSPRSASLKAVYEPRLEFFLPQAEKVNTLLALFRQDAAATKLPLQELARKWLRVTELQGWKYTPLVAVQVPLGNNVRGLLFSVTELRHLQRVLTRLAAL